jgi:murein DD-endopeptidase MepM/ murein hydrolase activator NlpD
MSLVSENRVKCLVHLGNREPSETVARGMLYCSEGGDVPLPCERLHRSPAKVTRGWLARGRPRGYPVLGALRATVVSKRPLRPWRRQPARGQARAHAGVDWGPPY